MEISLFTIDSIATIMCAFQNPLLQSLELSADMLRDRLAVRKPLQFSSPSRSFPSPEFPGHIINRLDLLAICYEVRSK